MTIRRKVITLLPGSRNARFRSAVSGTRASIVKTAPAFCLDVAAALLAFEAALFRPECRLGRPPRRRPRHGLAQQFDQAVDRVGAIALLGAETLGMDHDHAVLGHALAGQACKPRR